MEPNKRIGDYEVLEELGRGGMGRVYRVRNLISDRVEAMKVLLPDLVGSQDLAARFLREIKLLAALDHPHIAALNTALSADNQLVMIMEYVEGQSLASRLKRGPIATAEALTYIDQVLDALSYAHARHVVHRDIKPANMMLTPEGIVKLMDFGIARSRNDQTLTAAGTTTGSLSYMSPEQVNGEATDARSDLYSVGISLYEMVTGQRPFQADSDFAVMIAHLKELPRPPIELQPALGSRLNEIILTSIAKDPAERFQSAEEFRDALSKLQSESARILTVAQPPLVDPNAATMVLGVPGGRTADVVTGASTNRITPERARTFVNAQTPSASASLPQALPTAVPPIPSVSAVATKPGHPALYVALGAVLVITVLVGAGLYIGRAAAEPNRSNGTLNMPAVPSATPTATTPPPPVSAPATPLKEAAPAPPTEAVAPTEPPQTASTPRSPAANPIVPKAPAAKEAVRTTGQPSGTRSLVPESKATPQEPVQDSVDLDELEQELDQLSIRAGSVNRGLDSLQQQQARQGLGLRGDMVARQQSMNLNLSRAQEAVAQRNAARAQRYKGLAESDVEALERFLGR